MIELERHIEILLLDNDCVIVPDFGGFMAHHVDARFDERDYTFIPPLRTLGFNPKLTMNDSLLAQSYVEAYDISYPEAVKRISDEVREVRERISHDGSYELHNIGVISINDDGNYEFEPCEAGILTPGLYGLGSFVFKPISATAEQEETAQDAAAAYGAITQALFGKKSGDNIIEYIPVMVIPGISADASSQNKARIFDASSQTAQWKPLTLADFYNGGILKVVYVR